MSLLSEQPTAAGLAARLRDASEVTAELMTEFIGNACRRFPSVGQTKKTARIERLIGYGAWTDGRWRSPIWNCRGGSSRRITYEQGEWYCALSRQRELPDWLDQFDRRPPCGSADVAGRNPRALRKGALLDQIADPIGNRPFLSSAL